MLFVMMFLNFGKKSIDKFHNLKRLAQIVLAIPVTSVPSEQVFRQQAQF